MNSVSVKPWIGDNYISPDIFKYRTLILGESNYTTEENFGPELVINCVKCHLGENDDDNFSRFATKTRRTIFEESLVSKDQFWHSVAFYNFVQFRVGDRSRTRPTEEMWKLSAPAFDEVLSAYKPERILVLGLSNWNQLMRCVPAIKTGQDRATINYTGGALLAGYIQHPSSNLSYAKWGPAARGLLLGE